MNLLNAVEKSFLKENGPAFQAGDTVKVYYKILEGGKERLQPLEGMVIDVKGAGMGAAFTIRRISNGVGVERTFPVHSPRIEKIEVTKRGEVRKAKLYFLRDKIGKEARVKEKKGSA